MEIRFIFLFIILKVYLFYNYEDIYERMQKSPIEWRYEKLPKIRTHILVPHHWGLTITLIVNTYHCMNCKEVIFHKLKKLIDDDLIKENNIALSILTDVGDTEVNEYYYDLLYYKNKANLYIYNDKTRKKFLKFNDYLYKDNLYEKTIEFVRNYLQSSIEIESIEHFKKEYNSKKLIFVYFGRDSLNFQKYLYFIRRDKNGKNIEKAKTGFFNFFYYFTFEKKLRKKTFSQFKYNDSGKDIIGVFRHNSKFNKYDHENLIIITDFRSRVIL